jgi:UDP-N-acetyl-2-amino-2-deoxyglucuronate dehydrogenase
VEDTSLAIVRFTSGAVGTIVSSTAVFPGFAARLEITGTKGTVIIEDGRLVSRAFGDGAQPADGGPQPGAGAAADPADLDVSGHAAQLADLLAAIHEGRAPAVDGEAGRAALEIVCAVYESSRSGRTVTLRS